MATIVLGIAGNMILPGIGGMIGAAIGSMIDQQIMAALTPDVVTTTTTTGPRISEMSISASTEGSVEPRLYGRNRLGGQVIWCTQFKETVTTTTSETSGGGKGGGGGGTQVQTTTVYAYSLSFAVAFAGRGNRMGQLGRVWMDSNLADMSKYTFRFYPGSEDQDPDPLIQAKEGIDQTPAYRGTAYIVFEDMPLADFGNRMPQITAEVIMPLETDDPEDLSNAGRAYVLLPGSGEAALGTEIYSNRDGYTDFDGNVVETAADLANMNNSLRQPDLQVSYDALLIQQPNLDAVAVQVNWFGTDLRAGECLTVPKVEQATREIAPNAWEVATYTRATAAVVSSDAVDGRTSFGGTPSDETVREAVRYVKSKGQRVVLSPGLLMDLPGDNVLPNPYSADGAALGQPAFPGHGQITASPAKGYASAVDGTGAARAQVDTFFERTEGYRAMVLHYAALAEEEEVEAFLIGSGLKGLTSVRAPFIEYEFTNSHNGWTNGGGASIADASDHVLFSNLTTVGRMEGPAVSFPGAAHTLVVVDYERVSGANGSWEGKVYYSTAGHAFDNGYAKTISSAQGEPTIGQRITRVWDMAQLTAGGTDWVDNTITAIRLDFSTAADAVYKVYSIRLLSADDCPAVAQLCTLADDVAAIYGGQVGYAADWDEYHSLRDVVTGDVVFHMDQLWGRSSIDFVGINNLLPLTDWRDGMAHLDYDEAGPVSIYDRDYIQAGIEGGELYDWSYLTSADRNAQVRTPIVDLDPANEPWVYRQKDIRNWWANTHRHRPLGVRAGTDTAWAAQSKPIWFTQIGCPAVDKGTNQPSAEYNPRSADSARPYYSREGRDDFIQRLYLEIVLEYWRINSPTSSVYADKMVKRENMFILSWDTRPFPQFPMQNDVWVDVEKWTTGYAVQGRIEGAVLPRLVRQLCNQVDLSDEQVDTSQLYGPGGLVRGMLLNGAMDQRSILDSLGKCFQFESFESGGVLRFVLGLNTKKITVSADDLVLKDGTNFPVSITRSQEIDLPVATRVTYIDELNAYGTASVEGRKGTGSSSSVNAASFPIVLGSGYAQALATSMLHRTWGGREKGEFILPPSFEAVEAGDALTVPVGLSGRTLDVQVRQVDVGADRKIGFMGFDATLYAPPNFPDDTRIPSVEKKFSSVRLVFMDIPVLSAEDARPHAPRLAATASPWPGACAVYKDDGAGGFTKLQDVYGRASIGSLVTTLPAGPTDRWDRVNTLRVRLLTGGLASVTEAQLLSSTANTLAVQHPTTGLWEVLQFADAELISTGVYELRNLLRGLLGTKDGQGSPTPIGAQVVVLEAALVYPLNVGEDVVALPTLYRWGPSQFGPTDKAFLQATRTGTKAGLRPWSPCDAKLRLNVATSDLVLTWKRRARFGGDSWEASEVPLVETTEEYKVEFLSPDGLTILRSVAVLQPSTALVLPTLTYTSAQQVADYGSNQMAVRIRISQFGSAYGGFGPALEDTFQVRSTF